MRLDFVDLSLFRHVVEAGSITRGAERANLALAAASTRIRGMETDLGAELLVRGRNGVVPTAAGRTLLQHARTILAQTDRLRDDLAPYAGGLASEVRILSNTNALLEFLPERLGRFLAENPGTSVDLQERLSDEIVGLVAEGVGDIGIVAGTVDTGRLQTFPFAQDRFVVAVARGHPLSERGSVEFDEVLHHDLVGLDRTSALQRFLAGRAAHLGRLPKLRVQLRSFDGVCRLVEAGVGIGIVPSTTGRRAQRSMAIDLVELSDRWAERELRICVRDTAGLLPAAQRLVEHLLTAPAGATPAD